MKSNVQRREFLASIGTSAGIFLSGCISFSDDNGNNSNEELTEEEQVRETLNDFFEGFEQVENQLHPESQLESVPRNFSWEIVEIDVDTSIQELEDSFSTSTANSVDDFEQQAVAEVTAEYNGNEDTELILVVKESDEWYIYEITQPQSEEVIVPQVVWDTELNEETDTVTITHNGGDIIQSDRLTIETSQESTTFDEEEVGAGDSVNVSVEPNDIVSIVWESEDGGHSSMLFTYDVPDY